MIKLKDLIIETWNSNIWPSNLWDSDIWDSDIWPSHIWEGDNKKPQTPNDRLGKCYELSGKYVMYHSNSILVHGELTNPFAAGHPKLKHAWVEIGDEIFDPVMDKTWPKNVYESMFSAEIYKEYNQKQVFQMIDKHENWGPWEC